MKRTDMNQTITRTTAVKKFMNLRSLQFLTVLLALAFILLNFAGCVSKRSEMGVENRWRDPTVPSFEKGRSSEDDVMRALGPPSQVIALPEQTLFYYLREQSRTKALYLIIYNQTRQQIIYDRGIFFFNKQSVLIDFAYSKEAIPSEE